MTAIYQKIEGNLWKKDVVRLEKQNDGKRVMPSDVESAKMDQIVKEEIYLLEGLAFTGLHNNIINFDSENRNAISEQFQLPGVLGVPAVTILLDKTLPRLSFLRTSDPSPKNTNWSYHFLHLTFQKYFAARYFVRQWKARQPLKCLELRHGKEIKKTKPAEFLQKHKYHARYDIFWRFVSGLIDAEGERETLCFFQTIEEEPRDLLGPTHQRLVMHCLSEVVPRQGKSKFSQYQSELEGQLSLWLLFECNFRGQPPWLAGEREFPDKALKGALAQASDKNKILLFKSLQSRPVISPSIMDLATLCLIHSVSQALAITLLKILQRAAVEALQSQEPLPEETVKAVAARLGDKDRRVRRAAVEALQSQGPLSEETVKAVAARLEDENEDVRRAAVEALQNQVELTSEILDQYMKPLYLNFLKRSFNEHITWYVADGISYITVDIREIPLKGQLDQLGDVRWKAQERLAIPVTGSVASR